MERNIRKGLKLFFLALSGFIVVGVSAQEIEAKVTVISQTGVSENNTVLKELEQKIQQYINAKIWNRQGQIAKQKMAMNWIFSIDKIEGVNYQGKLQVSAFRTIFNTKYQSPIFWFNDLDLNFSYRRGDDITASNNVTNSSLIPIIDYYSLISLGLEQDSFSRKSGTSYYMQARSLIEFNRPFFKGWDYAINEYNRASVVDEILAPENTFMRDAWYEYHRQGMDQLVLNIKKSKKQLYQFLKEMLKNFNQNRQLRLFRLYLETKQPELVSIFKEGPATEQRSTVRNALIKLYPAHVEFWNEIKD